MITTATDLINIIRQRLASPKTPILLGPAVFNFVQHDNAIE